MLKQISSFSFKCFHRIILSKNHLSKENLSKRYIYAETDTDHEKQIKLLSSHTGGSIELEKDDISGLAIITINNESKKNAISGKMMIDLSCAVDELETWTQGRSLILKGSNNIFCSGADIDFIRGLLDLGKDGCGLVSAFMQTTLSRLYKLPLISIAMVEGFALGGGAELSTSCDLRALGPHAYMGFVHTRMGLSAYWGAPVRLIDFVGRTKALQLLSSAKILRGQEALDFGLVNVLIPEGLTEKENLNFVKEFLEGFAHPKAAPEVLNAAKKAISNATYIDREHELIELNEERKIFKSIFGGAANLKALNRHRKFD